MEEDYTREIFTAGHEVATFLVSCGILSKAWEESLLASNANSFTLNEYEGIAYVAFPSFHKRKGFIVNESRYGEGNIQTEDKVFSDCLKGNDDKPALVHQGVLKLFLRIMKNTDLKEKLQIYTDSNQRKPKPVIFVGHSLGGAVATLATLWLLEKRLRQSSPFCITFGCPLVGDERLVEAVGRENWGGNLLHVVSQHDIVPRMLLAPLESIIEPLTVILPYWHGIVPYSFTQDACRTLFNSVRASVRKLDKVLSGSGSPFRPFGTYMFCSSKGATCIGNSETVFKMLQFTMLNNEKPSDKNIRDCFSEHIGYDSVLKHVIKESLCRGKFSNPDTESSYEIGISLQLEAIGVGSQNDHAGIALRRAGDIEGVFNTQIGRLVIELSFKKGHMAELEWYKESCSKYGGIGYYDSFRNHNDNKDWRSNLKRLKLAEFWDEIIEMWKCHELPPDFQARDEWIKSGTTYRRLLEPLDIAYFYRTTTNPNGNYLSDGRPDRHKVLQKWFEEKVKTGSARGHKPRTKFASLAQDSCFWAHVEEALKDLKNLEQGQHQSLQNLEQFEDYVTRMIYTLSISSDVFFEESSFMKWWKEWKKYNQNKSPEWRSPLYEIMENESWKVYILRLSECRKRLFRTVRGRSLN